MWIPCFVATICSIKPYMCMYHFVWVADQKEKAGIQLKYIPEKRDTFEMYPGKVVYIIAGINL